MDSQNINASWDAIVEKVKQYDDIDIDPVSAFFKRLHPQAMSEGFLMLTAENAYTKKWVEENCLPQLHRALDELYGVPFRVMIDVYAPTETVEAASTTSKRPLDEGLLPKEEEQPVIIHEPQNREQAPSNSFSSSLTFENFVIGESNRMAYSMAVTVAEEPGQPHLNPLFIYGKSGLGKTHLLCAIQNYIRKEMPQLKTIYTDSAALVNDYTDAGIAHDKNKESYKTFKNKYEDADVLLIDDIQYLQGKTGTLDVVFQIFNTLILQGKQVVLSADRSPKNIDLDERYVSRFTSGGTFDIQPPEVETKLGIIKSLIRDYKKHKTVPGFTLSEEIQHYIAENSSSNIRELKGAVTRVIYMSLSNPNLTVGDISDLLQDFFSGGPTKKLTVADIQKEVESFYKISHADLVGRSRTREIAQVRHIAIYLCRQMLDIPFAEVGKKFNRDHTSVMHSCTTIEEKLRENRELREEIQALRKIISDS